MTGPGQGKLHASLYPTTPLTTTTPVRGPCPMLNTLANHGYIPRDGRNMTRDHIVSGLVNGINLESGLAAVLWQQGLEVNPDPNAVSFTLDQLNAHNVLEHDASMTRADAALGNNHLFNEAIFQSSRRHWTAETVTVDMMATTTVQRQIESKVTNRNCDLSDDKINSCVGQASVPITVFGDLQQATVRRSVLEYWFRFERLPTELGWVKKTDQITLSTVQRITGLVENAVNRLQGANIKTMRRHGRRDMHGGLF
ncbi:sterigmatocystin biosynthesis peroxidase stcC [Pyrenophora seminiperda CCB06]|uniref:Sterigmatocystin biosynthesis peroxidase stcC n=1 Tax=Pyrenophora seminiperda CCB06 TaxID=1302712 RepID=A0A3M7MAJ1_9PLEO|nr:sterigmatocystin biosynthesis peroxidase stcC [Pyrenophora seminiperda CCB06]